MKTGARWNRSSNDIKIILAFAAIYLVWGSTYLAIKYGVETIPPFMMMGLRSLIAGSILYGVSALQGDAVIRIQHWRALVIIGASFFLVGHGLLAWAQRIVPSGLAALVIASEPLWVMTIESLWLRDSKIRLPGLVGLGLGFVGMAFLVFDSLEVNTSGSTILGLVAIMIGTVSWGAGAVYSRVAVLPRSPSATAGLELMTGGILLLAASAAFGEPQTVRLEEISLRSVLGLTYLIIFGSVITFGAYIWLLKFTSATRVSTHAYVNPVIAVLIGWFIAGESLSVSMIAATILIISSVYLILKNQGEQM